MTRQGAALSTDCNAGGYADINYYSISTSIINAFVFTFYRRQLTLSFGHFRISSLLER